MGLSNSEYYSGILTIIVDVFHEADEINLLEVKGNTVSPGNNKLSDVEWFKESWSLGGSDILWEEDDCPKQEGKYVIKGKLHSWQDNNPDSSDWNEDFEIESIEYVSE